MPVVSNKYRGATKYFHVLAELVRAAQYRGVTTYQDIAVIMGLPPAGNLTGKELGLMLGAIAEDEVNAGRPMLSSVAVSISGKPGAGFYALARELGRLSATGDERAFWEQERSAAYAAWKRPLPSRK
jgi:hypothetical protein